MDSQEGRLRSLFRRMRVVCKPLACHICRVIQKRNINLSFPRHFNILTDCYDELNNICYDFHGNKLHNKLFFPDEMEAGTKANISTAWMRTLKTSITSRPALKLFVCKVLSHLVHTISFTMSTVKSIIHLSI